MQDRGVHVAFWKKETRNVGLGEEMGRVWPKGNGHGPVQDLERFNRSGPMPTPHIKHIFRVSTSFHQKFLLPLGQKRRCTLFLLLHLFFFQTKSQNITRLHASSTHRFRSRKRNGGYGRAMVGFSSGAVVGRSAAAPE